MKYWDTSALLRAWKEGWTPATGMTRAHTLAEWVHIQAGRGLVYRDAAGKEEKRALPLALAVAELKSLVVNLKLVDLTGEQTVSALEALAKIGGLKASAVHDFMHVRAAELHQAEAIVTLNLVEWARLTKARLEPPAQN